MLSDDSSRSEMETVVTRDSGGGENRGDSTSADSGAEYEVAS